MLWSERRFAVSIREIRSSIELAPSNTSSPVFSSPEVYIWTRRRESMSWARVRFRRASRSSSLFSLRSLSIRPSFSLARLYASTARSRFASSPWIWARTRCACACFDETDRGGVRSRGSQQGHHEPMNHHNRACRINEPDESVVPGHDGRTGRGPVRHECGTLTTPTDDRKRARAERGVCGTKSRLC